MYEPGNREGKDGIRKVEDASGVRLGGDPRRVTAQFLRLQHLADNSRVVQMQKLQRGRLNVVGEHHTESNNRRQQERELASSEVGGEYWTEDTFRTRAPKLSETFEKGSPADIRAFGDPLLLRIAESVQYFQNGCLDFSKCWKEWTPSVAEEETITLKSELAKILVVCKTHFLEVERLVNATKTNEEGADYDVFRALHLAQIEKLIPETKSEFLTDLIEGIWKQLDVVKLIQMDFDKYFREFVTYKADLMAISAAKLGGATLEATSRLRSMAMDAGATKGAAQVGVWKIGYDHVNDIRKAMGDGESKNYLLIQRDEFNEEYRQLPVWKEGKMVVRDG